MLDQDGVAVLMGEINSASALTIMQVAARNKRLFMQIGARSDALRGKNCNRYTFHVDIPNTVMVNAVGKALVRDNMVKDKKFFTLTADYMFGHDLLNAAKRFFDANGGKLIGDELIATDVTDFSPYLLKIRQAKPDVVCSNLAGNQVTNLIKQYAEFGLPYPIVGFNLNTADAWAAGDGNLSGTWPTVWYHTLDVPASKTFVANFIKKNGKPPENHAWIEYVSLKIMAQAMNETKSTDTDKLIAYFEKETEFDILKARKAHFRILGSSADAGGLSVHGQAEGPGQGQVGFHRARRRGARRRTNRWKSSRRRANRTPARCDRGVGRAALGPVWADAFDRRDHSADSCASGT